VRVLEQQLGPSKNTVQSAYDELAARGLIETRPREGVFVASGNDVLPAPTPAAQPPAPGLRPVPALFRTAPPAGTLALSSVFIDPDLLPREALSECVRAALRRPGLQPFCDFQGHRPLREAIASRLRQRGMEVRAENVITTVGSQQGIDIVARTLSRGPVAVEDPVYPHALSLMAGSGVATVGLPLDPFSGIDLDRWEAIVAAERPSLLYCITSFQNPTGYSYSSHEIARLLAIAERHGVGLMEDDWGSEMLPDSEYRPTLRLMGGPNVLYLNSFTKKVLPALRIGYAVAPEALVPALVAGKRLSTLGSQPLMEAALTEFLERGYYDTHLSRLQAELDRRYQACLATLRRCMPEGVRWTTPGGGPTLWLDLPGAVNLPALRAALSRRGITVEDTSVAFSGPPHLHGFRVSYAHASIDRVERGIIAVAEELEAQLGRPATVPRAAAAAAANT
jgi:DNA-binding transcriptional MocR family regulator